MITALVVLSLLTGLMALHPFLTYPLSLRALRWIRGSMPLRATSPAPRSLTVMISARNEARVIKAKLTNVVSALELLEGVDTQILLFADGCTDATADIARRILGPGSVIEGGAAPIGKSSAMNAMARRARGEVLVLTDANALLRPGAIPALLHPFKDPQVGVALGSTAIRQTPGQSAVAGVMAAYWRLEERLRDQETALGSAIGGDGALYAIRRSLWPFPARDVIDDFFAPMSVLIAGYRVVFAPEAQVSEPAVSTLGEEGRRKFRIAARALRAHAVLRPGLRRLSPLFRYMYFSHKVLKWTCGLSLAVSLALLATAFSLAGYGLPVAVAAILALAVLVLGRAYPKLPVLGRVQSAAVAVFEVSRGTLFGLMGGRIASWTPPTTDREGVK
ncbi:MAG: glycosyltransferase [Pseudomonadota bacterium]